MTTTLDDAGCMNAAVKVRIGTIGGPETFAGQATQAMNAMFPFLASPVYFPTGATLFDALRTGLVDAVIGAGSNLGGDTELARMLLDEETRLFVVAEAQLPFGCQLLGRAGAQLDDIRLVHGGPASIAQASAFLSGQLPAAATAIYSDPLATGVQVAQSDGSEAVLGTAQLAARFGLSILAADVDGGIINGNWWALARKARFEQEPRHLIVTARWPDQPPLADLLARLQVAGFSLSSISTRPSQRQLFEADHLMRFAGTGTLAAVEDAVAAIPGTCLKAALAESRN